MKTCYRTESFNKLPSEETRASLRYAEHNHSQVCAQQVGNRSYSRLTPVRRTYAHKRCAEAIAKLEQEKAELQFSLSQLLQERETDRRTNSQLQRKVDELEQVVATLQNSDTAPRPRSCLKQTSTPRNARVAFSKKLVDVVVISENAVPSSTRPTSGSFSFHSYARKYSAKWVKKRSKTS